MTPWRFLISFINAAHERINAEMGQMVLADCEQYSAEMQALFLSRNKAAFDYLAKAELPSQFGEHNISGFRSICRALAEAEKD